PSLCVLAGPIEAISVVEQELRTRDVDCTRVRINVAAHSHMLDPILADFEQFCRTIHFKAPTIPFVSNVTGTWITDEQATDATYWVRHLRQTVQFTSGFQSLMQRSPGVLCEVGPGRTLTSLVRQQQGAPPPVAATLRHPKEEESDVAFLLAAIG